MDFWAEIEKTLSDGASLFLIREKFKDKIVLVLDRKGALRLFSLYARAPSMTTVVDEEIQTQIQVQLNQLEKK